MPDSDLVLYTSSSLQYETGNSMGLTKGVYPGVASSLAWLCCDPIFILRSAIRVRAPWYPMGHGRSSVSIFSLKEASMSPAHTPADENP